MKKYVYVLTKMSCYDDGYDPDYHILAITTTLEKAINILASALALSHISDTRVIAKCVRNGFIYRSKRYDKDMHEFCVYTIEKVELL